jgi:hypothetical protein
MITALRPSTVKIYFEFWPLVWLWPISLVLMQVTLLHLKSFEITLSVVICHVLEVYIVVLYWLRRPPDAQIVTALGLIAYTLGLGLFAWNGIEFGRSLALFLNLIAMVLICLNARLATRPEIRRSVAVFCVAAAGAGLFIIAQALTFQADNFVLSNILGPLAPIGPGNEVYDVTAKAPPPRPAGFYSEPSVAGWFMTFATALALACRRLYPVLTTLAATICALAAMATLSLTGVLGAATVLAGYVLLVRDRLGYKLLWLGLAGTGVTTVLVYAYHLGILERFHNMNTPGTSVYFRMNAPSRLISESLDRFPFGYPLGQTNFIASRHYYFNWLQGTQTTIDNTPLSIVFYFGILGLAMNATYLIQLARYLLLRRHPIGLLMLSLLISLATTGAGWGHHVVLMIGYAIVVGRYLHARGLLESTLTRKELARLHSAAVRRVVGTRNAASSSASRALAARRWRALT